MFNKLRREHMGDILNIRLKEIDKRLAAHKITIDISADAKEWLCDAGYNPSYGARPLNRVVKTNVLDPLSRAILSGAIKDEETARFVLSDGRLKFLDNHVVEGAASLPQFDDEEE